MMSVLTASGWWYGTPLDLDLICILFEEPHLVRVFHLRIRMNGSRPWLMMMMHTYRMRPDGAGVYSYTLAQSILPRGRVPLIVAPRTSCISGLGRVKPT